MASWWQKLKGGLQRSSQALTQNVTAIFAKRKLDAEALEELEEALIAADLGVATAAKLSGRLAKDRFGKDVSDVEVKEALAGYITEALAPVARPLVVEGAKPFVVLVAGVNGTGKTTTIGKLAAQFAAEGQRVGLVAGDTFRAAAIEQLEIWGERAGAPVFKAQAGADPAGLVFDAIGKAREQGLDVLLVDTAGRLHNKGALMDELKKVVRVMQKQDPGAPHASLLVLDATTGQNAHRQVEIFKEAVDLTGLVVTKLDGSARGGVVVALAEAFALPVHAVGVGEGIDDLKPFEAKAFARALLDLEPV
ncbi:MAG: signal recognition particle-docking protein FtsY [Geminicoccaceae bacterium]|nr:MAG: signal recognition particle-docking protein FtsY [Geminicoccaceae bacterium]